MSDSERSERSDASFSERIGKEEENLIFAKEHIRKSKNKATDFNQSKYKPFGIITFLKKFNDVEIEEFLLSVCEELTMNKSNYEGLFKIKWWRYIPKFEYSG